MKNKKQTNQNTHGIVIEYLIINPLLWLGYNKASSPLNPYPLCIHITYRGQIEELCVLHVSVYNSSVLTNTVHK